MAAPSFQEGSAPLDVVVCADAEMDASGSDKTGSNANVESRTRRSMAERGIFPAMFSSSAVISTAIFVTGSAAREYLSRYRLSNRKAACAFYRNRSPRLCKNGKCLVWGKSCPFYRSPTTSGIPRQADIPGQCQHVSNVPDSEVDYFNANCRFSDLSVVGGESLRDVGDAFSEIA
jgi:hypothetical protein